MQRNPDDSDLCIITRQLQLQSSDFVTALDANRSSGDNNPKSVKAKYLACSGKAEVALGPDSDYRDLGKENSAG